MHPVRPNRSALAMRARCAWMAALVLACCSMGGCDDLEEQAESPKPIDVTMVIGSAGVGPGQFASPRAMTTDGEALWVIDKLARVQRIDPTTGRCTYWFRMPEWEIGKPTGTRVLPGPEGQPAIWIADTHYHRVMIYALPGTGELSTDPAVPIPESKPRLIASFGEYGTGLGQFTYVSDVAVLTKPDGKTIERIYVSEYGGNDRITVFDASYKPLFNFGSMGSGAGKAEFERPQGMVVVKGPDGPELIVTDSVNHRVGRFSPEGKLIAWLGQSPADPPEPSRAPGRFSHPRGVVDFGDGTLLVTEFGNNRLQRIDAVTGQSLGVWGQGGRKPGQLGQPWAAAVVGKTVYALDTGNNRIEAFAAPNKR